MDNILFSAVVRNISASRAKLFPALKLGHIRESVAFGFGARTAASLPTHTFKHSDFDQARFVKRLADLTQDWQMATAVGVLSRGFRLSIDIEKLSPQRMRSFQYSDIAYDVTATLHPCKEGTAIPEVEFILPEHRTPDGQESFRVDSAHTHRTVDGLAVRSTIQDRLLSAKLINGSWQGGLYIYSNADQQDDRRCMSWVRASMSRAILCSIAPVYCAVFRDTGYEPGHWRIKLSLNDETRRNLLGANLRFDTPVVDNYRIQPDKGYWRDINEGTGSWTGEFVDGVWQGIARPNGEQGLANLVPSREIEGQMLAAVTHALELAGAYSTTHNPAG